VKIKIKKYSNEQQPTTKMLILSIICNQSVNHITAYPYVYYLTQHAFNYIPKYFGYHSKINKVNLQNYLLNKVLSCYSSSYYHQ
jgi:hypothetical protein